MKRTKRLVTLLAVLGVVSAVTLGVVLHEEEKESIQVNGEVVLSLSADSVQALSWTCSGVSLAFHQEDGWVYDGDDAFPVDEDKIAQLLEPLSSLGASFTIENVEDESQYGLDDPVCTIQVTTEDRSYEIKLGDFSSMDQERYLSMGDGNVYLVTYDLVESYDVILSDLIRHDEGLICDQVTQMTFAGAEDYSVLYQEDSPDTYCTWDVYFAQMDGESKPLDTERVSDYMSELTSLGLTSYVTYDATEDDLAAFGLDDPELSISVDYTAENEDGETVSDTFILSISRDPEELAAAQEAQENGADEEGTADEDETVTAFARVGDSPIVYVLTQSKYEALMAASYEDLRHREVLTADFADITGMEIELDGDAYTLTTEGDGEDRVWSYQEEEIDTEELQAALESLTSDRFTEDTATGKTEISLTISLDNADHPQVKITFYRHDGSDCLAVVDDVPLSLVARSDVVALIEVIHGIVLN